MHAGTQRRIVVPALITEILELLTQYKVFLVAVRGRWEPRQAFLQEFSNDLEILASFERIRSRNYPLWISQRVYLHF